MKTSITDDKLPSVSVVIPTHNRKDKLIRLINSILQSNYSKEKLNIIVIDDASTDGTYEKIRKFFPKVYAIRNEKEKLVAGARNLGIKNAKGEYILFIDDDNIVEKNMIKHLVHFMNTHKEVGVCAPLMLYFGSNRIWCMGIKRNMITSRTTYLLNGKRFQENTLPKIIESEDFPNCFMVRSEIIKKYNILFDEKTFPIHYEESDFCYRIKKLGYKVACYTRAIVWHDVKRSKMTGFETEWRTYFTARNRIIFHKKYSKWWQFLIFILIFNWLFTLYYLRVILLGSKKPFRERLKIAKAYLKGVVEGISR